MTDAFGSRHTHIVVARWSICISIFFWFFILFLAQKIILVAITDLFFSGICLMHAP
jgi:hypothetical protein